MGSQALDFRPDKEELDFQPDKAVPAESITTKPVTDKPVISKEQVDSVVRGPASPSTAPSRLSLDTGLPSKPLSVGEQEFARTAGPQSKFVTRAKPNANVTGVGRTTQQDIEDVAAPDRIDFVPDAAPTRLQSPGAAPKTTVEPLDFAATALSPVSGDVSLATQSGQQKTAEQEAATAGQPKAVYADAGEGPLGGLPEVVGGVRQGIDATNRDERYAAGSKVLSGAMNEMAPLIGPAALENPVPLALGYGTGAVAGAGAAKVTEAAGGSPEAQEFANQVGFFIPSMAGMLKSAGDAPLREALARDIWEKGYATDASGQRIPVSGLAQARAVADKLATEIGPQTPWGKYSKAKDIARATAERPAPSEPTDGVRGLLPPSPKAAETNEAVASMARAQAAETMGTKIANGQPIAPPPAPAPKTPISNGQVSPDLIDGIAKAIQSLPEEARPQAMMEAHQKMTEALVQQGKVVGPDGKLHVVENEKQASKLAQTWMNEKVSDLDKPAKPAEQPAPVAENAPAANPKGLIAKMKAAIEKASVGSEQERVVQESKATVDKQIQALKEGTVPVVFLPAGSSYVPQLPEGFKRADVKGKEPGAGVFFYDPALVSAREIKDAAREGTHGTLMGHVQDKADLAKAAGTVVVQASSPDGTPVQDSEVDSARPDLVKHQAEILAERHPGAEISVKPTEQVIGERMRANADGVDFAPDERRVAPRRSDTSDMMLTQLHNDLRAESNPEKRSEIQRAIDKEKMYGKADAILKDKETRLSKGDTASFTDNDGVQRTGVVKHVNDLAVRLESDGKKYEVAPGKVKPTSLAARGTEATAEAGREASPALAKLSEGDQTAAAEHDVHAQAEQMRANLDEIAEFDPELAKQIEEQHPDVKNLLAKARESASNKESDDDERRAAEPVRQTAGEPQAEVREDSQRLEAGRSLPEKSAAEPTDEVAERKRLQDALTNATETLSDAQDDTSAITPAERADLVSNVKDARKVLADFDAKHGLTDGTKAFVIDHKRGAEILSNAKPASLHDFLHDKIAAGNMPANNVELRKLVSEFDGKPASDARLKESQEEMEVAVAQRARDIIAEGKSDRETFDSLVKLYNSQPNLNVRTSTSVQNQAYSTPAPLAFIASRLAGIDKDAKVYEPTAGTGMLLIGAKPKNVTANELNKFRADTLKEQGYKVTEGDALKAQVAPNSMDAVIANPPFGSVKENGVPVKVKVDGYSIGKIDHLIAARALDAMKDDGKATIILGADKVTGGLSTDDRIFFNWLYSHYNVASQFEVSGNLYGRQGANWPVRIISIDGRSASSKVSPMPGQITRANTWEEVYGQFDRSLGAIQPATSDQRPSHPVQRGEEAPHAPAVRADAGRALAGTDRAEPAGSAKHPVEFGGARPEPLRHSDTAPAEGLAIPDHGLRPDDDVSESTRLPEGGTKEESPPERRTRTKGIDRSTALVDPDNAFQVPYSPASSKKDVGVLIPTNMKAPLEDAMMALEDRVGDIDKFAQKELGYKSLKELHHALMGLQIDSVAAAIDQIKQRKAAIIADQTGIGKGRQAAAIIRWAVKNDAVPVFVTQKPELFTDMFADLADIGSDNISPFLMNSDAWISTQGGQKLFANSPSRHGANLRSIAETGELPQGRNALFTTYSQINKVNTQQGALRSLAPRAIFILDESHTAGGESATGEYIRSLLADASGVTYLSATYAKRPDNMPLYFKTDMGLAIGDSNTLIDAMANGGLPLQTVVSHNLVKAGQMFRRERSFKGVDISTKIDVDHGKQHSELADKTTLALRAIVAADHAFHNGYVVNAKREYQKEGAAMTGGGNKAEQGLSHGEFTSVVHNFVKQMLLSLKSETAADEAIEALKRNEKPIIAVENTMGSFLNHYVADHGIREGHPLTDFDYRTVLSRALDRTRHILITTPQGDKIKKYIPLSELDPETRKEYDDAQKVIDGLDLKIPVSPIDWIRNKIEKAGYSVSEITGRNLSIDYSHEYTPRLSSVPLREQNDKVDTTRRFNGGKLDVIVANVAGATGISLHASEKFPDQRIRHMIVVQPAADINTFMQMLGRIHRTGQVKLPRYTILNADLPAEKRPTALLSKKMKSLNANTSSNTESATSIKAPDMLNKYGDEIIGNYLNDNPELESMLDVEGLGEGDKPTEDIARKATGRLAILPVKTQEQFYNDVEHSYNDYIKYLNDTNQNDLEPRTFDYDARETRSQVLVEGEHPASPFGQDAVYGEYSIKAQSKPLTTEEVTSAISENLGNQTGSEHAKDLIATLNDGLNKYIATLNPESVSAQTAGRVAAVARSVIQSHPIGTTMRVEINGEPYSAAVVNVTSTHRGTGNPFSMSKIKLTLATTGPLRFLHVPATQLSRIEIRSLYDSAESVFNSWRRSDARETAKIVTGNLLAAYGELLESKGTIINFTKADGTVEQGILLPKKFEIAHNTRGDFRMRSPEHALNFLKKSIHPDIETVGIASRDGNVRILRKAGDLLISTPKSKARGGKYFLDPKIIDATGDFTSSGNFMRATIPASKAKQAIGAVMDKTALYALPSMAEEAKSFLPKKDKAADALADKERVVPGARSAVTGDETKSTSIRDLTDSIARQIPPKTSIKSRLSKAREIGASGTTGGLASVVGRVRGVFAGLLDAYMRPPQVTDYEKATGEWSGADNVNALDLYRLTEEVKKAIPDVAVRKAITHWVQANGDEGLLQERADALNAKGSPFAKEFEAALKLTDEQKTIARNTANRNEATAAEMMGEGMISEAKENYMRQVWKDVPQMQARARAEANFSNLITKPSITKQSTFPTYFDGMMAGYTPKNTDFAYLTATHERALRTALASRAYIRNLMEGEARDGRPLIVTNPSSARTVESDKGSAYLIRPNIKPDEKYADYRPLDHPSLRGWRWVANIDGKDVMVQGDALVHPDIYQKLKNNLSTSAIRNYTVHIGDYAIKPGDLALKGQAEIKSLVLSLSGFHQTTLGIHGLEHRVLPAGMPELDMNDPDQKFLVDSGMMVASYDAEEAFSEGVASGGIVTKVPGIGPLYHQYLDYLFKSYMPRLKMEMGLHALARNRERYQGKMSDDQIGFLTAKQANAAFGGLNYRMLGRNKTFQDVLRLSLMAPDFLEARARFVGQAAKPHGGEQLQALLLGALVLYTAARLLNELTDGQAHWDKAFSVVIGGKEYHLRTIQEDLYDAVTDPGRFSKNRLSPIAGAAVNYMDVANHKTPKNKTLADRFKAAAQGVAPIPAQPWVRKSNDTKAQKATESILKVAGVNVRDAKKK